MDPHEKKASESSKIKIREKEKEKEKEEKLQRFALKPEHGQRGI